MYHDFMERKILHLYLIDSKLQYVSFIPYFKLEFNAFSKPVIVPINISLHGSYHKWYTKKYIENAQDHATEAKELSYMPSADLWGKIADKSGTARSMIYLCRRTSMPPSRGNICCNISAYE